jgi:hypothetical protein
MMEISVRSLRAFVGVALGALGLVIATTAWADEPVDSLLTTQDLSQLKMYHAYSASDGRTYIETMNVPAQEKRINGTSGWLYLSVKPAQVNIGRSTNFLGDWHYAGAMRHIIVPLQDEIAFDVGDGKIFYLKPGEAILAEDWTGKGHRSGCASKTRPTCLALDITYDANPMQMPLRDPPKKP